MGPVELNQRDLWLSSHLFRNVADCGKKPSFELGSLPSLLPGLKASSRRTRQRRVFLPTRATWPLLKVSGNASIINFASANAYHALQASAAVAHCAGKGGELAITRQLAMEGAPFGIRANSISPGFIRTAATQRHLDGAPDLEQRVLAKTMLKFLGEPSDVAALASFLASDEARYITAADHAIDAGATAS